MSNTRNTGYLTNIIQYTPSGNISFVSGSTTLMSISSSGAITTTGVISGSTALSASNALSSSYSLVATTATTASSISNLNQNVAITGSLTTTGQIVAQTLNVQQVTSSIVYSSGSNIFGSTLGNTQQLTGSVTVTGSFAVATTGTELLVGSAGVTLGNVLTDNHNVTGSLRVTGSVTVFNYSASLPSAAVMVSGSINAISAESKFAYGTWNDPSPGNIFDAKFGGTQNGIAVRGTSYFSSSVGIGTNSPISNLQINGNNSTAYDASVDSGQDDGGVTATIRNNDISTAGSFSQINMMVSGDSGRALGRIVTIRMASATSDMAFVTENANTKAEKMRITAAGNVGIGTTSPSALLTVAGTVSVGNTMTVGNQGGVDTTVITGGSGFGSKINFNSPSGVAAQITGNTDSFVNRFTGNFGIGTISPTHKLDVSGNINIPGGNQLVFNNEANVWAILARTSTSTTNLGAGLKNIIYCGGGANEGLAVMGSGYNAALEVSNNGNAWVRGTLTKGGGSFRIDHPLPEKKDTHYLYHSFIEGPKADLIYRGKINLINGIATVNIDEVSTMTEGTFELLTRDVQCFVNNINGWDLVRGNVVGNILTIESQNPNSTDQISWMVVAERNDEWFRDSEMTDENGNTIVEKLKPIIE